MSKIVFSGIQPTGILTIGHYLGIFRQWLRLQNKFNCYYCIVDLHAMTLYYHKQLLHNYIYSILSMLLAIGINPQRCVIFLQSHVPAHTQLYWVLNCFSCIGELKRMTQFKSLFQQKNWSYCNMGLFSYPVLMAADILLYNTSYVPIGKDQIQHLEFTRNLVDKYHNFYKGQIFLKPKYLLSKYFNKIMALLDPNKKMSKSDKNINNSLLLLDNPERVIYKIQHAVTDSDIDHKIVFDNINKPGISNLLTILSGISNISISKWENFFLYATYSKFKEYLSFQLNKFLFSIQQKYFYYYNQKKYLLDLLLSGAEQANVIAKQKIDLILSL